MPHIIVEHSYDISKNSIINLQKEIQNIMASINEGNFDADQCKVRSHVFDEYLVGKPDQLTSSFIHITIKILSGRTLEAKKKLSEKIINFSKRFYEELVFSPTAKDQIIETAQQLADAVTGIPHAPSLMKNMDLAGKRCDISVDIVDMDRKTYQKVRIS